MSQPPGSDTAAAMNFTELTLALPGEFRVNRAKASGSKRGFSETVDLSLRSSGGENRADILPENEISSSAKPPERKAQVVGWPPVRGGGIKKEMERCKYVKVAVDGAPYLRKVDLEMYRSYEQLLSGLMKLFGLGVEFVPTFQDKDGDWMMLGDVPWNMFVESCKRLRLMKSSEDNGLGKKSSSKCSGSSEVM